MDLSTWIDRWADLQPDKTAVRFDGAAISYTELAGRIGRLAGMLQHELGVQPGDRVAHLGLNSPELLDLAFACARLGAILVPLNWRLAAPEHLFILHDCGAGVLLVEPEFQDQTEDIRAALPGLKTVAYGAARDGWPAYDDLLGQGEDAASGAAGYESPFLLVYTSGTTGKPKGAVLSQNAILWNAINSAHNHDLTSADHILTTIPMFHVGGLNIQTLPALHAGATVTLQRRFDPGGMLAEIANGRPSLTVAVPAMMQAMIGHPDWADTDLTSLRGLNCGSAPVPEALIRAFLERGVPVGQVYGATETAPIAVYLRFEDGERKIGSCGKPAIHCDVRIVREDGGDAAVGEPGEIVVRGPNVMTEYWGNPEATAEALKDGWFYTGDIAHRDEDGYFHIDDRKKDVVISGGENVYPAELENVLADCPMIAEAAVIGCPDERWGEVPVAYIVRTPGADLTTEDALALFAGRLARYKHPHRIVFVEALPRNAMGKVQKFELRERAET